MTITKHLYLESDDMEGNYPVMIRIEHHGIVKCIPTSVTCRKEHWNDIKCQISEIDSLHRIKNETIDSQFRRIAGKIQDHLDNYLLNNLDSICDNLEPGVSAVQKNQCDIAAHGLTLINLIEAKMETITVLNTRRGYKSLLNYCTATYGEFLSVDSINRNFISTFDLKLKKEYSANPSTRHLMLARMRAVLNHAKENGTLPMSVVFKLPKVPLRPHDRNLSETSIKKIFRLYKDTLSSDPCLKHPTTFAIGLFILDIAFQGLAPVDLASLRMNQIKITYLYPPDSCGKTPLVSATGHLNKMSDKKTKGKATYNPIKVILIRTARQKTGQQVSIVASFEPLRHIIEKLIKNKEQNDFLIPCFTTKKTYTPEQRQDRLANYFYKTSCHLNNALKAAQLDRGEMGYQRRVTFYYARHAFCNLIDGLDVPRHLIQHMIGHRTTVLETNYLRTITPWEQAQLSHAILSPLLNLHV